MKKQLEEATSGSNSAGFSTGSTAVTQRRSGASAEGQTEATRAARGVAGT